MTPTQAAKVIGCHPRYVRTLIHSGQIKAKRVRDGKDRWHWEITQKEAERFRDTPQQALRGWPRGKSRKRKGAK